ncbi:hypothetical protein [Streptomyces sp. RKAG337]|uniref:hypothetical protein n=1 Tax=Streptomyces sp. RKAG337 TaxID=2893404 RepID=UPI002033CE8C|nr:hypothetical protein [Streptomyces sp. RKAG337]MCM2430888.1 hypothetical protein [Streptomyces sp. RKAG337]
MRLPIRHISGHLLWTKHAAVWGVWKVDSENYTHASRATKRERLDALEALFKSLRGEVLLLSLCPQVDAASVVTRMTSGVDLDKSPEYIDLSLKVLDQLEDWELSGRVDFIAVPLPNVDFKQSAKAVLSSAQGELLSTLGMPVPPVSVAEEESRFGQADGSRRPGPPGSSCGRPPRPRSCGSTGTAPGAGSANRCFPRRAHRAPCAAAGTPSPRTPRSSWMRAAAVTGRPRRPPTPSGAAT